MEKENLPRRTLEPGTIDKTRKNIGPIDAGEAMIMQKKLGGEVLREKSAPSASAMPSGRRRIEPTIRASGRSSADISSQSASFGSSFSSAAVGGIRTPVKKIRTDADLPEISAHDLKLMDRMMMSPGCEIKPDFGLFNFFYRMSAKNRERVQKKFGEYLIPRHVEHIQAFIGTIKTFIQISPDIYKAKIATETDLKFKFLRTVGKWTMRDIKVLSMDIENASDYLTIPMLIPFVRAVYRMLLTVYYIGDQQVSLLIKDIYSDLLEFPNSDKAKLQTLVKQAVTDWLYIHDQIIQGMYPLLMRMSSDEFVEFPDFFKVKIGEILKFLGISKFDLLLPEKKKKESKPEQTAEKKKPERRHIAGEKNEIVNMGLKILDQLFPQAGFLHLEKHPDLFPYFNPIYNFEDGFNVIAPENPLHVTIVLILIIEDFFKGCRNIKFNIEADEKLASYPDKLDSAMEDWASYYEDLFSKKLGDYLRSYVNSIYSQKDYAQTKFGKENLNNILWRIKFYFLPSYKFNAPVLQKPINDARYRPLAARTDYIRTVLTSLVRRIDENMAEKKTVLGVLNPWDRYTFDLPNAVSKRIDVLLGAKREDDVTAATNANLIRYTLCTISVLDWWINNSASPAYDANSTKLYRISEKDGAPLFSVPERNDQNQLFAEGVKKAIEAKRKK
ncbi:hypothetical protein [Treponema sp.]|uniref:hypothetical protein n=1 Tax=Treponema sp. TaxID=166 RepID=UPI003F088629